MNLEEETEDVDAVNPPLEQDDDPIGEDAMASSP